MLVLPLMGTNLAMRTDLRGSGFFISLQAALYSSLNFRLRNCVWFAGGFLRRFGVIGDL